MGLKLVTPPAANPVTLAEAKAHLRVTSSDTDAIIDSMVKAATRYSEIFLGRAFVEQKWDLYLDEFPTAEIKIPLPPLIGVESISYYDTLGSLQNVDVADYYVDNASQPGWVVPQLDLTWPDTLSAINSVIIRFSAGYIDNSSPPLPNVPFDIKAAILLLLGTMFEHREDVILDMTAVRMPWSAEMLLRNYKIEKSMA